MITSTSNLFTVITTQRVLQLATDDIYDQIDRLNDSLPGSEHVLSFHLVGSGNTFTDVSKRAKQERPLSSAPRRTEPRLRSTGRR